ncbi:MAG: hypothetical protein DRP01_06435 [Archaeoglobales archaeon]|nr:MAG: hypothetical protein DRP01_06435 [Archaeoglobales archaeon]
MFEVLIKDFRVEIRRRFEILASLSFVLISSLLIAQASLISKDIILPSFFIVIIFLAVFTSTTSFVREMDSKTIYGLKLLPIHPYKIFLEKSLFTFLLILFQGFLEMFFLAVFSSVSLFEHIPIFIIFSFYIATVSSFSSALVMYSEGRGFLIPMLIFIFTYPVLAPLLRLDTFTLILETLSVSLAMVSLSPYILED